MLAGIGNVVDIDWSFVKAKEMLEKTPELIKKVEDFTYEEHAIHLRAEENGYWRGYHSAMDKVRHNMQMAIIRHVNGGSLMEKPTTKESEQ